MSGQGTCYCGCDTQRNRCLWPTSAVLGGIAIACIIASIALAGQCNDDGMVTCPSSGAAFWIFVLFAIAATIPCYMMCCCSSPPQNETAMAAKGAVPLQGTVVQAAVVAAPHPPHVAAAPGVPYPYPGPGVPPPGPPPQTQLQKY